MNGRILALVPDVRVRRTVLRVLAATRSEVVEVESLASAAKRLAEGTFQLAVLDHESCGQAPASFLEDAGLRLSPLTRILLLAGRLDDRLLAELLAGGQLTHLVARTDPLDTGELLVTCEKILRGDIFGMEKYLGWGIEPEAALIRCSDDREHVLERLRRYLDGLCLPSRFAELACSVADELLMNAVYNAPVDGQGKRLYAQRSRSEPVVLGAGQEAIFRYACDGRLLALSMRDPFGSLERDVVFAHLARGLQRGSDQISAKAGGAGLGFYYIFSSVSHFVINLAPGRATEMIGLLDVSGPFKAFAARPRSINFFFGEMRWGG